MTFQQPVASNDFVAEPQRYTAQPLLWFASEWNSIKIIGRELWLDAGIIEESLNQITDLSREIDLE